MPAAALALPIAGAAIGALSSFAQNKGANKGARYLDPNAVARYRSILFPELDDIFGLEGSLWANLAGGVNQSYGNAVNSYNDILGRSGLVGPGWGMGGHGALNLARGASMNQAQVAHAQALFQALMEATGLAIQGSSGQAGATRPTQSPLLGALTGAGYGLGMIPSGQAYLGQRPGIG